MRLLVGKVQETKYDKYVKRWSVSYYNKCQILEYQQTEKQMIFILMQDLFCGEKTVINLRISKQITKTRIST